MPDKPNDNGHFVGYHKVRHHRLLHRLLSLSAHSRRLIDRIVTLTTLSHTLSFILTLHTITLALAWPSSIVPDTYIYERYATDTLSQLYIVLRVSQNIIRATIHLLTRCLIDNNLLYLSGSASQSIIYCAEDNNLLYLSGTSLNTII